MNQDFKKIVSSFSPNANLIGVDTLPGGYSSDVYILNLREESRINKIVLRSEGSPTSENRISTEYHLIQCLKDSNLPLPEAIHIDMSLIHISEPTRPN